MPDLWMDVDIALPEVPVNTLPLIDDTDFKTIEDFIAYDAAGMDLVWNFVTTGGVFTQTAVTPTTAGLHDWTNQVNGMYTLEITASAGTINNDTEGFGYFTGVITGVLPFRGPTIGFRAAALNNALIDGGDDLDVNVTKVADTSQTAGDIPALITTADAAIDVAVADLANGTDGLGALKVLIDTVNTDLSNGTDGLGALKILVDAVNTDLGNGTDGLGALKTLLDAIPTTAMRGTDNAATETKQDIIDTNVDSVLADTGTDGVQVDLTQTVPANTSGSPTTLGDIIYFMRQWIKNKLDYNKSTDVMVLRNDADSGDLTSHTMTDDASNATRGAG